MNIPSSIPPAPGDATDLMVQSHIAALMEHFDSVQVFCSRHNPNGAGTATYCKGAGNWYARYGQVREWVIKEEEEARVNVRKSDED